MLLQMQHLMQGHHQTYMLCALKLHYFLQKTRWDNHDLVTVYKDYVKSINPQNLSLFIESYLRLVTLLVSYTHKETMAGGDRVE